MPPESLESPSMASAIAEEDIARVHLEREKSAGQAIRDVVEGIAVKEKVCACGEGVSCGV